MRRLGVVLLVIAAAGSFASGGRAGLGLLKPTPNALATFSGHGGFSSDGLGETVAGGAMQAEVPAGSKVEHAYLYGAYAVNGGGPPPGGDLVINFDGQNVTLAVLASTGPSNFLSSARADVTAQVAAKVGAGGGATSFIIGNDPVSLDGLGLVVIYSNPNLPTTTIAVLDGAATTSGDQTTFAFAAPLNPALPGFTASLALGSGHSFQGESGHVCGTQAKQSSIVDVNGQRLTSCAGSYDDGAGANGALVTVGGVGDSLDRPTTPAQEPADGTSPRVNDDELYDIKSFLRPGDASLTIRTANPSGDDLVFLAIISVTAQAGVTTGGPPAPKPGKTFNAQVVSGTVSCRPKGSSAFVPVSKPAQFATGSECDTTHGRVRLTTSAGTSGGTQAMDFFSGRFFITQPVAKNATVTLVLSGGDFKSCGKTKGGHLPSDTAAGRKPVRRLWGKGKGHYRTKGRYSSATVRGTYWLTEDRCDGTYTKVLEGVVEVQDVPKRKKVTLKAGQSYLATPRKRP